MSSVVPANRMFRSGMQAELSTRVSSAAASGRLLEHSIKDRPSNSSDLHSMVCGTLHGHTGAFLAPHVHHEAHGHCARRPSTVCHVSQRVNEVLARLLHAPYQHVMANGIAAYQAQTTRGSWGWATRARWHKLQRHGAHATTYLYGSETRSSGHQRLICSPSRPLPWPHCRSFCG